MLNAEIVVRFKAVRTVLDFVIELSEKYPLYELTHTFTITLVITEL